MDNTNKLTAADHDFMRNTYPHKSGDKWDATQGGNMPSHKNHMDASIFGVRLGSKQQGWPHCRYRDQGPGRSGHPQGSGQGRRQGGRARRQAQSLA